ncbi:MAG: ATP-binding cassette domain-containing protein [Micrococcales bacterium]|nr:ATP-binding cassette domain-containing protein [Micrococcales bacterium]
MTSTVTTWGVRGLVVRYGATTALDGVDLTAAPGQVVAVVGGDGAGKTTLLRALVGGLRPTAGQVDAPDRRRTGFMPTAAGVWRDLTVDQNVDFVAAAYGLGGALLAQRRTELLEVTGLGPARDRLGGQLSGGMRQKLAFGLATLHRPDLLVLDEPTTGVDPVSRAELWRLISRTAADGAAVVLSTTYLDEAERAAQVLVLAGGRPLLVGTPDAVRRGTPGTVVRLDEDADLPDDLPVWRRGHERHAWLAPAKPIDPPGTQPVTLDLEDAAIAASLAQDQDGDAVGPRPRSRLLSSIREFNSRIDDKSLERRHTVGDELVRIRGVSRRFGDVVAVDEVDLDVAAGEIVGLVGANGAGKTTLLRLLLGLLPVDSGQITALGAAPSRDVRRRIGYVPQSLGLYADLTVAQNLEFVARCYGSPVPPLPPGLDDLADRTVRSIGLGRQRRLAFTAALGHDPDLLVLDEPTSGVDPLARTRLWDTIRAQAEAGVGVLVTTHYMQEAEQCDRLVLMATGRVVAAGSQAALVGDTRAVQVRATAWTDAFTALADAGLPVVLDGTAVRVAATGESDVRAALTAAGVEAQTTTVPATLDEVMAARA